MESYLQDWLSLLLRWAHFITGVAWIGASFYFNWLENHLQRQNVKDPLAGDLWAVHGGGFYYLQKYKLAPDQLPATLHWFKWEAYFTWLTGFALLCTIYYWNAGLFMVDRAVADITPQFAVVLGLTSLVASWLFYDLLCRSSVGKKPFVTAVLIFSWFAVLAWLLCQFLSGRAAYMQVGAAMGTLMVANVLFVIIPSQKELVAAVTGGRTPDAGQARDALQRSRHNNYFTLPVLFIMISTHYASTFGHSWNWLVLLIISLAGVGIRHWFNIRHLEDHQKWVLPVSLLLLAGLIFFMRPGAPPVPADASGVPTSELAFSVIQARCVACHATEPAHPGFSAAPMGITLDDISALNGNDERVYQTVVVSRSMPLANTTGMTDEERDLIAQWFSGRLHKREVHE
jgi:uncharacterized membrane protein